MKEYKGLRIPGIKTPKTQDDHCDEASTTAICVGVNCKKCLFAPENVKIFNEWLKEKGND